MRFSRYTLIGIGIGAAIFLLLVVLQVACSGSDSESTTGATGPASGSSGGTQRAGDGPLEGPVDDGFVRVDLAAGETPPNPYGIVFAEAATGDGEYWSVTAATGAQGEFYGVDAGHRWLQWLGADQQRLLIADRTSGETYALDTSAWGIIAGPSAEGILVLRQANTQSFTVVDLAADPSSKTVEFELDDADQASRVVQLAGSKALLFGGYRIDLTTGDVADFPLPEDGFTTSFAAADGGWLDVTFAGGAEGGVTSKRHDAAGNEVAVDAGNLTLEPNAGAFAASPDGRWVAIALGLGLRSPEETQVWPTVALADLQTGQLVFRAVRVSTRVGLRSLGWLPDSSGLLVATTDGFAVLRPDGALEALPFGPVEEAGVGAVSVPVPSLADAGRYLVDGRVVDASGDPQSPEIAAAGWASTEPWNNYGFNPDGTELRFMQSPSLGRGFTLTVLTALGLPSRIERPPFPGEVTLRATEDADLHLAPDAETSVVTSLNAGDVVSVTNDAQRSSSAWPDVKEGVDFSVYGVPWWVHVRTNAGMQGWVLTKSLSWAE